MKPKFIKISKLLRGELFDSLLGFCYTRLDNTIGKCYQIPNWIATGGMGEGRGIQAGKGCQVGEEDDIGVSDYGSSSTNAILQF